jgi:hypothetical protein
MLDGCLSKQQQLTDIGACSAIRDSVEQADEATGITDGLLVPDDLFIRTMALIFCLVFVFLNAECLVGVTNGEDEE